MTNSSSENEESWSSRAEAVTQAALVTGALNPIETRVEVVPDRGIDFQIYLAEHLRQKPQPKTETSKQDRPNPFLPYDPQLFVGDLGSDHVVLLNKFPVTRNHLLVVTRDFAPQEQRLDAADLLSLAPLLWELGGVAFFNSSVIAGASQPHRHLQLIPEQTSQVGDTLLPGDARLPVDALLKPQRQTSNRSNGLPSQIERSVRLPFEHALVNWAAYRSEGFESSTEFGEAICEQYDRWLNARGWTTVDESTHYNLLITKQWMMAVPRVMEEVEEISLNAMAFAGTMLAKSQDELDRLRSLGPMTALTLVAG